MNNNEEFGFDLEHLLFKERKCRVCGEIKDLVNEFYLVRKNKRNFPSAYSYECKICTVKRIVKSRKNLTISRSGHILTGDVHALFPQCKSSD